MQSQSVTAAATARARHRGPWRAVALPSEHGGWGLTAEPILLGLLVEPSISGVFLGLAGVLAFLARTPLKLWLVDRYRHRELARTHRAAVVASVEIAAIVLLGFAAAFTTSHAFLWPLPFLLPLVAVDLWFERRSRGRQLVPELAGSAGAASLAAVVAAAGGAPVRLALALWLILTARAVASIPFVRRQVAALHGRTASGPSQTLWDVVAVVVAALAVAVSSPVAFGAIAVFAVVVIQRAMDSPNPPRAAVLGMRQTLLGLGVVLVTWLGTFAVG
jgi:hypothetical protein